MVDPWALPPLAIVPLIPAVAAILTREPVAYVPFALVFVLYLLLVFPVSYRLQPLFLEIRAGILRWRIPYAQMRSVRPARNLLTAPALSLRRLEILYGPAGRALISPADRPAFLADLYARVPHLELPSVPDLGLR